MKQSAASLKVRIAVVYLLRCCLFFILGALSKKLIPTLLIQETSLEDEQIDVEVAEQPEVQLAATKKNEKLDVYLASPDMN